MFVRLIDSLTSDGDAFFNAAAVVVVKLLVGGDGQHLVHLERLALPQSKVARGSA